MNTATAMYALGLDQVAKLILSTGNKRTVDEIIKSLPSIGM